MSLGQVVLRGGGGEDVHVDADEYAQSDDIMSADITMNIRTIEGLIVEVLLYTED